MLKTFAALLSVAASAARRFRVGAAELAGVAALTCAAGQLARPAAFAVAGVALLVKAMDWEQRERGDRR